MTKTVPRVRFLNGPPGASLRLRARELTGNGASSSLNSPFASNRLKDMILTALRGCAVGASAAASIDVERLVILQILFPIQNPCSMASLILPGVVQSPHGIALRDHPLEFLDELTVCSETDS